MEKAEFGQLGPSCLHSQASSLKHPSGKTSETIINQPNNHKTTSCETSSRRSFGVHARVPRFLCQWFSTQYGFCLPQEVERKAGSLEYRLKRQVQEASKVAKDARQDLDIAEAAAQVPLCRECMRTFSLTQPPSSAPRSSLFCEGNAIRIKRYKFTKTI